MLTHPLLERCGVVHGFGVRGAPDPAGLRRPRQVHGARVVTGAECAADPPPEADVVVGLEPGVPVGVLTADCVPVLVASEGGRAVAAIHAGWRGLAAGVVASGIDALRRSRRGDRCLAAIGPHIGPCCYEVDAPVLDALRRSFPDALDATTRPSRPGHVWLDLGALVAHALVAAGLSRSDVGVLPDACTCCDAQRFHSHRRDGARAGRLVHHVAPTQA